MLEIIKISNQIKKSNDILITAGLLTKLKNKILFIFNKDKKDQAQSMIEQTTELKPKLVETYELIKNIEKSIDNLDVDKYEFEINNLQFKVDDLSDTIKKIVSLTNEEESEIQDSKKEPSSLPDKTRHRWHFPDDSEQNYNNKYYKDGKLYKNLNEFGKQFGVDIQYGPNIVASKTGVKSLFASWATFVFTGSFKKQPDAPGSLEEFKEEYDDPKKFSDLQDRIPENEMGNAFYKNLSFYDIIAIEPRETVVSNDEIKKKGEIEVFLISPWISPPAPLNNWKLKAKFVIVDNGDPTKLNNFIIYRQWIIEAKKVN